MEDPVAQYTAFFDLVQVSTADIHHCYHPITVEPCWLTVVGTGNDYAYILNTLTSVSIRRRHT